MGAYLTTNRVTMAGRQIKVSFQPASFGFGADAGPLSRGVTSGLPPYLQPEAAEGAYASGEVDFNYWLRAAYR